MSSQSENEFWTNRYISGQTGWDIGYPSTPIKSYFDQLEDAKGKDILIPGAGNAYEAEYLHKEGFTSVNVLDISTHPLDALASRVPSFPKEHLIHGDFFTYKGQYDFIVEQTFFCSFEPTPDNRKAYAKKMHDLLKIGGILVGLWFDIPLRSESKRPYGGHFKEYLYYFEPYFEIRKLERCYNSIEQRQGSELFGLMVRKDT